MLRNNSIVHWCYSFRNVWFLEHLSRFQTYLTIGFLVANIISTVAVTVVLILLFILFLPPPRLQIVASVWKYGASYRRLPHRNHQIQSLPVLSPKSLHWLPHSLH